MNARILLALAFVSGCMGGEKPSANDDFTALAGVDEKSDAFTGKLTLRGSISYGETQGPFKHSTGKWSALKFAGDTGDQISVDVKSTDGDTVAWVLDNDFNILGYNDDATRSTTNSHIDVTLPANASRTHYIVVRDYFRGAMRFTVTLQGKPAGGFDSPCKVDADCALVRPDCCSLQNQIGVRADEVAAFRASLNCPLHLICPAIAIRNNHAMPECQNNKCVAVLPADIACGAHSTNSHACPDGFSCEGPQLAFDGAGQCFQQCGGIAGFGCDGFDQICVDNPNDSCDPGSGGADCMGECRDAICSGQTARCAAGYHWDQFACNCVENTSCGGFANFPCATGKSCIDNPNDSCDPSNGGADCPGICVASTDCRASGCTTGQTCSFCWGSFACIPKGAVC